MKAFYQRISYMDAEELNDVARAIRRRRKVLAKEAVSSFEVGDVVEFDTGKRAGVIQGKILRKNIKNIIVRTQLSDWNVTASLLTKVAA